MEENPESPATLGLADYCRRIEVSEREVRYALARGIVPPGMELSPGRGHHRQFDIRAAFWLAVVLRLKSAGIKTPLAGEIVKCFAPLLGSTETFDLAALAVGGDLPAKQRWALEVGDGKLLRARYPSSLRSSRRLPRLSVVAGWLHLKTRKPKRGALPIVIVRIDLTELALLVLGARTVDSPRKSRRKSRGGTESP
jgi:hypothetical protein